MPDLPVTVDELAPVGKRSRRFELILSILLGLAAIAAGWAAYQADLSRGDSLRQFQVANRLTAEGADLYGQADVQRSTDEQLFVEYLKATLENDLEGAAYIREELSPDLSEAIRIWESTPGSGPSPFAGKNPAYYQPLYDDAQAKVDQAEVEFQKADDLRRDADAFTLIGVLLASALFLYGIAAVSRARKIRWGLTGVGFVIYLGSVIALIGSTI
jgi:hypothetical protein